MGWGRAGRGCLNWHERGSSLGRAVKGGRAELVGLNESGYECENGSGSGNEMKTTV